MRDDKCGKSGGGWEELPERELWKYGYANMGFTEVCQAEEGKMFAYDGLSKGRVAKDEGERSVIERVKEREQ